MDYVNIPERKNGLTGSSDYVNIPLRTMDLLVKVTIRINVPEHTME